MNEITEKIQLIIKDNFGLDEMSLKGDANFSDDLGIDSLDIMELLIRIEKEFNIKIPDEDAEKLTNTSSIIAYVQQQLN